MKRVIQAQSRSQCSLLPKSVDDFIAEDNPVQVIDVFVDDPDFCALGFEGYNLNLLADLGITHRPC